MITEKEMEWIKDSGERLKNERISSGRTVEEIASAIKLSVSQIEAIENGNIEKLPPLVYTRGFIRAYSVYLGVSGFDSLNQERSDSFEREPLDSGTPSKLSLIKKLTLPLLLFLLIIILSFFYNNDISTPKREISEKIINSQAPSNPPVQQRLSSPSNKTGENDKKEAVAGPDNEPNKEVFSILRLKITQECWLRITIDDTPPQQYKLEAGDTISWKAASRIVLDIGNAGGIEGDFNGKPLTGLGKSGEVVHLTLDASIEDSAGEN